MSEKQPQYPSLDANEIISPKNAYIKWHVQAGSPVQCGQLIAMSSSIPFPDFIKNANLGATNVNNSNAATTTEKPKIIRARRRNRRNVPPKAAASSASSSAGNSNSSTGTSIPQAQSSFLGQYIQPKGDNSAAIPQAKTTNAPTTNTTTATTTNNSSKSISINISSSSNGSSTTSSMKEVRAPIDGLLRIYVTVQCRKDPQKTDDAHIVYVLGKIEPCTHPAIIDGLCAVCGQKVDVAASTASSSRSTSASTSFVNGDGAEAIYGDDQNREKKMKSGNGMGTTGNGSKQARDSLTLSGGVTVSISKDYAQTFSSQTSQSLKLAKKLNLVLDLDHTLLHATADRRAARWVNACEDVHTVLLPAMEGHPDFNSKSGENVVQMYQPHFVKLRPHLAEFVCDIMTKFEVTIYTAGTRLYAEKIADVVSRHVSDHLRLRQQDSHDKNKDTGDDGDDIKQCLDEGELNLLREQVERTKKQLSWYKSQKERKEYVQRMIAEHDSNKDGSNGNKQNMDDSSDPATEADEKKDDVQTTSIISEKEGENGAKTKKRKRVAFNVPDTSEKKDSESSKETPTKVFKIPKKKEKNKEDLGDDPTSTLEKLQQKLKVAEALEAEAQNLRKKIFGSRIVSRTDVGDLGRDVKSLKRVFPCGGMMAAIVDDREDVWANADNNLTGRKGEPPDNLLLVKPYHFKAFQKFADVNNSAGEDLTASSKNNNGDSVDDSVALDEAGEQQLLWTSKTLEGIHNRYYDGSLEHPNAKTVPSILKKMRSEVLSNSNFVSKVLLSGLVPLHRQNPSSDYSNSPRPSVVRYAEELGAKLQNTVTGDLTHVIAARDGTDKILRARRIPGCAIVKVSWLMECYWSCTLRDIKPYSLGPPASAIATPNPQQGKDSGSQRLLFSGSDSSEEDDDEDDTFFDDFEKEFQ